MNRSSSNLEVFDFSQSVLNTTGETNFGDDLEESDPEEPLYSGVR